jgi:urease accessory protein
MSETGRALYRLMSWLSPNYPVGAFAYSHGLEFAVETGRVADVDSLTAWIDAVLIHGTGRVDGPVFRETYTAVWNGDREKLDDIVSLGQAFQGTAEFLLESRSQGVAFLTATRSAWPEEALDWLPDGAVYPVAVGAACAAHGIQLEDGLQAYFHAFAANLVSAGVRLVPLGQTAGQKALSCLEPSVAQAGRQALEIPLDEVGTAAPLIDIDSMQHETQYSRLFRS